MMKKVAEKFATKVLEVFIKALERALNVDIDGDNKIG